MSDIEEEAYSEAMDEIDKLNQLNDRLIHEKANLTEVTKKALAEAAELKTLVIRAADALEIAISQYGSEYEQRLITELRKAAE